MYFLFKANYVNIVRAKFRYMLHGTLYLYLSSVLKKKGYVLKFNMFITCHMVRAYGTLCNRWHSYDRNILIKYREL